MAFWTTEKLLERLEVSRLISDHSPERVACGAYELGLGQEYFVTADGDGKRLHTKQQLDIGQQLVIPPGQFALLISEEAVQIPPDVIGFISIKASEKFKGLVNISGFHVDPGFRGRLKFSVQNAGTKPIILQRKHPLFLIWFSDLDRRTAFPYNGKHNGQMEITADDVSLITGEVVSPAELKKQIDHLSTKVNWAIAIAGAILMGIVFPYMRDIFLHGDNASQAKTGVTCECQQNANSPKAQNSQGVSSGQSANHDSANQTQAQPSPASSGGSSTLAPLTKPEPLPKANGIKSPNPIVTPEPSPKTPSNGSLTPNTEHRDK